MINAGISHPTIGVWTPRISLGVHKQWLTLSYLGEAVELTKPVLLLLWAILSLSPRFYAQRGL